MDKSHSVVRLSPVLLSGLLFGLGLTVSGMINPAKVIGFLDIAGQWDPTLLFVMGAGLAVTLVSFRLVMKQGSPLLEEMFHLPSKKDLDARLILGAVLFGVGWGLAGFCPGPALTAVVFLDSSVVQFVAAMVGGMLLHFILLERGKGQ
jgi:uncharacterized membrane protein YedE/YeeE